MKTLPELHPQFITNPSGDKTAVILPIDEYNEILEDLEDLAAIADRIDEPTIPHKKVLKELKNDGYLSD